MRLYLLARMRLPAIYPLGDRLLLGSSLRGQPIEGKRTVFPAQIRKTPRNDPSYRTLINYYVMYIVND